MRRIWIVLASASLVAAWGCGGSYNDRLDRTLRDRKYAQRLNEMLMPPPQDPKFKDPNWIFIRPPKDLQPVRESAVLVAADKFGFDLAFSFLDSGPPAGTAAPGASPAPTGEAPKAVEPGSAKQSMHILARVKQTKKAAPKKKGPEPAPRGEFTADVLAVVNAVYPKSEVTLDKFKPTTKKANTFKQYTFAFGGKNVHIYLYNPKNDPYEVALIFEYPTADQANVFGKIELCLETFAVDSKAKIAYSGGVGEPTEGAPAPPSGATY
jgi:hypothetical protein